MNTQSLLTQTQTQTKPSPSFTPVKTGVLQRKCACGNSSGLTGKCSESQKKKLSLQRMAVHNQAEYSEVPPIVHEVLRSPGQPLDPGTRTFMESRFGHNFSQVRVHTGGKAAKSAQSVNALAYTVGRDVVFNSGQYTPDQTSGKRLLAHELTHVVQQSRFSGMVQPDLQVGAAQDRAEIEADRVADDIFSDQTLTSVPSINSEPTGLRLRRQPTTPQQRGGQERLATLQQPPRGEDQVRIHVFRYLCNCMGRNVSRSSFSGRVRPRPGIVYEFCRGRVTARVVGEVVPSSFTTGTATVTGDINIAPGRGGTGVRVQVEGEGRNTGSEPQVGGRVRTTIEPPRGPNVGVSGEIFGGTESGQIDTRAGVEIDLGDVTLFGEGTNLQDEDRRGALFGVRGRFGGPRVERQVCRECLCPVVYECLEDIPPREFEEQVPFTVTDRTRLRYYFRLNSNQDARDPALRRESIQALDRLAALIAAGGSVASITGYASPEADERSLNQQLSESRARRLHQLVQTRLGADVSIPEPEGRGELLGRRATILPGSALADAILDVGFSGPEEVSDFLVGDEIDNDQLADQFLGLLSRVTEPEERLRLFGISPDSPIANQLLTAIERFIASGGRGRRPWERVFEFLRFATVEVTQTRQDIRTEQRRTRGSIRRVGEALCNRYAQEAEQADLFGAAQQEPNAESCPTGSPRNLEQFADQCDYDR